MFGGAAVQVVRSGASKGIPIAPLSEHIAICIINTLTEYKTAPFASHREEVTAFLTANPKPSFKNLEDFILALSTPLKPNKALHNALIYDLYDQFNIYDYKTLADAKQIRAGLEQIKNACKVPVKINMEQKVADCIIKVLEDYKKRPYATHREQVEIFLAAKKTPSFESLLHFILSLPTFLKPGKALHCALTSGLEAEFKAYYFEFMPEEVITGLRQINNACTAATEIHNLCVPVPPTTTIWSFLFGGAAPIYTVGKDFPGEKERILAAHGLTAKVSAAEEARRSWEAAKAGEGAGAGAGAGAAPR